MRKSNQTLQLIVNVKTSILTPSNFYFLKTVPNRFYLGPNTGLKISNNIKKVAGLFITVKLLFGLLISGEFVVYAFL